MKKVKYISFLLVVVIAILSCKDEDFGPIIQLNAPPQITAPAGGTSIQLVEAEADQPVPTITWTAADFGFDAGAAYRLEMEVAGRNFAEPVTLANINALSLSDLTQGELNNILLAKELEEEVPVDIDLRVSATVSGEVQSMVSEVVTITVTPYASTVVIPQLQVPGSYQGWDPANNTTIIFSPKSNGLYEGYVNFQNDNTEFKFTQGPSWDLNWGDDGADGSLNQNGANILAPVAGVYKLNVDLNGFTYSHALTNWGLIGSATPGGWDSDQNLSYDAANNKLTITLDLVAGEIKFRANDDWAINFGDDGNNKSLEYGTANIPVAEAGNYTIDLLIIGVAKYKYTITKN